MAKTQCQCPDSSMDHAPGKCKGYAYLRIERNGKVMVVCGDCILSKDKRLED